MTRFDVYTFDGNVPLVVNVQADILSGIGSTVVIPLAKADFVAPEAMPRLKPVVTVGSEQYRLITTDIIAVPTSMLGERVANLESQREIVVDAIDFLLQGF